MAHIGVVIPVYKAANCLNELYSRLKTVLEGVSKDFEIVFIEDCGGDSSWEIIKKLAATDPRVKGFQFSRNFGQHYGITAGLDHCDSDWVVVMDCDLQDPPEDIARLYVKAKEGFDVVLARRMHRKQGALKRLTSGLFYKVFGYLSQLDYDTSVGNFRIMSRQVVKNFRNMREELRFFPALMDWMGFQKAYINIEQAERFDGKSAYTYRKLINLASHAIIAYSDRPLKAAIKIGFLVTIGAFAFGSYTLYRALVWGIPVSGWASLIVSIYFLGGIIIGTLGIIGVYLGKTFSQSKHRPLYIINKTTEVNR